MLNQECLRDLLLYIDENQTFDSGGTPDTFKLKSFCEDETILEKGYSLADISIAVSYLCEKGCLESADYRSKPKRVHITRITSKGYDYIQVIRTPKIWEALRKRFGKVFEVAFAVIIEAFVNGLFRV